jgi:signal transduction histidine kinase
LIAMMLVVAGLTAAGLYFAQRNATGALQQNLERDFQADLDALHKVEELRYAALAERCRALVAKPRIHAALEDNALDLLYPSAKDELRDIMQNEARPQPDQIAGVPRARFYRFLDRTGAVLAPPNPREVGALRPDEEAQLALKTLPQTGQIGYLLRNAGTAEETIDEIIALPIGSTETGEFIAALVIGFKPLEVAQKSGPEEMKSGIWLNGWLHLPALPESARVAIDREMTHLLAANRAERSSPIEIGGDPYLLFFKRLNPGSAFPPVYEVCVYPLRSALTRQHRLRWQILGAGGILLLIGLAASHLIAKRLSAPVAKLAIDSEENRARRKRVEAALASKQEELQRSTRFSADASHQLKTPVTVLRAGIEELLRRENLEPVLYDELSALHHQTYRLTGVIDDLLLLSRMDAGRLKIEFSPVNLTQLVEEWLDDLNALPDPLGLDVKTHLPASLLISGERRYTSLILQNLLENARKYNRPGGRIHVSGREEDGAVFLTVGNSGPAIPPEMHPHIFERFSRGANGEKIAGHGIGLNLARELARLHGGELQLVSSENEWTEFEVRFRPAEQTATAGLQGAGMKNAAATVAIILLCLLSVARGEDFLDRVDEALTFSSFNNTVRTRISGTLDLEGYAFSGPAPGLILTTSDALFNPRLSLFVDAQLGPAIYAFTQTRVDRGFDPSDHGAQIRLDEYAVRITPWEDGRFNLQAGQFATVVGTWVGRHLSWDNPFVNAPLPYENVTGIEDKAAPNYLLLDIGTPNEKYEYTPVIWGPSYATGVSVAGRIGQFDYAAEIKNASLSSRPESWPITRMDFDHPCVNGRIGFRPNEMWTFGFSASDGAYFRPEAMSSLPFGRDLGDYHERLLGQDISFAWHHWQFWAEFFEARFEVPGFSDADTFAYYLEAKYKFTPQFFAAVRWNQQFFGDVTNIYGDTASWGRDLWRADIAAGYRFTAHTQLKVQYSFQRDNYGLRDLTHMFAAQFTVRF